MTVEPERLNALSTEDLARACAQRTSRQRTPPSEPDPCYELFCRAFAPSLDDDAWKAILNQYRRLVSFWLGQYASEDTIQEVFLRFWKAQRDATSPFPSRFPNISAVTGYLKRCAIAVYVEARREEEQRRRLWEKLRESALVELVLARARPNRGHTSFDFRQLVLSRLKNERERVVLELTYYYNLTPREIQTERPDLFSDRRAVYRVKENLLRRLGRDRELQRWWAGRQEDDDDNGGDPAHPPV